MNIGIKLYIVSVESALLLWGLFLFYVRVQYRIATSVHNDKSYIIRIGNLIVNSNIGAASLYHP